MLSSSMATIPNIIVFELFRKQLSETDILTRLIIPVRVALMDYLPSLQGEEKMLLEVRDREGRVWVFVYSKCGYSSMFTGGGWREFAVKKGLRPEDMLRFFLCRERVWPCRSYFLVDAVRKKEKVGDDAGLSLGWQRKMEVVEYEEVGPAAAQVSGERRGEKKKKKVFGVWLEFE